MPARHLYHHHYLKILGEAELQQLAARCSTWGMNEAEFAIRISDWFDNFEQQDWPLALKVILALEYHNEAGFHRLLKKRQEMVQRHLLKAGLDPQRVVFAVPDDLADSATRHAHPISKVWQLPNERFISFAQLAQLGQAGLGNLDTLILFNDTYGSGRQFMRDVWPQVVPQIGRVGAVLIVGAAMAKEALDLFGREAHGAQVIPNYPVASVNHLPGFTAFEVARLQELGRLVYGKHPFGFGGCGLLLAYHFQCPNNSLPLIWADGVNNALAGQHTFPWTALFPYLTKARAVTQAASGSTLAPVSMPAPVPVISPVATHAAAPVATPAPASASAAVPTPAPTPILREPEAKPAWASNHGRDEFGWWAEFTVGDVVQRLRYISAGQFLMGSPDGELGRQADEGPQHTVTISRGFWLADTACTQALWQAVMGDNPSKFKEGARGGPTHPVEQVSWDDIRIFLPKLNAQLSGGQASLPTEAEWEYACRAGTTTPFSFGTSILTDQVNYNGNAPYGAAPNGVYRERTLPVMAFAANPWGLYQMHGNVWEWCADWPRTYTKAEVTDPGLREVTEPEKGDLEAERVLRGGSWFYGVRDVRSASRYALDCRYRYEYFGFRLALRSSPASQ